MEEKEIQPAESMAIISAMINTAKNKLADDGVIIIFWGWLVFIAAITHYVSVTLDSALGNYVWAILMPLGGIYTMVYKARARRNQKVSTHLNDYLRYAWFAFLIALTLTLCTMTVHGFRITYFFIMVLYGMAIFISGALLNFRPLMAGSLFSFLFALISVFAEDKEVLLCMAGAVLCSYIVPGHLLRSRYRSENV